MSLRNQFTRRWVGRPTLGIRGLHRLADVAPETTVGSCKKGDRSFATEDRADAARLDAVPLGSGGVTVSEADAAWLDLCRAKRASRETEGGGS